MKAAKANQQPVNSKKILDHRGAHLQLARAEAMSGDKVAARKEYQDFLSVWKDADPDVPVLKEAKADYERMK